MQHLITRYRFYTALALLLIFAATQFPFELFHSHVLSVQCAEKDNNHGICHHKSHVDASGSYCWACTIHVEKTYLAPAAPTVCPSPPVRPVYPILFLKNNSGEIEHTSLRGPPHFTI
ncbi:MAG: hypothetical protein JST63_12315 [Bacteroidetes bacterium]|nr:hypothetical protein [Bacteroidota bacterium]